MESEKRFMLTRIKSTLRELAVDGQRLQLTRSFWWDETTAAFFQREIEPYWLALPRRPYNAVWDLGAASGLFTLSACVRFRAAKVAAFEPSRRQRILLSRNVRRNGLAARVTIEPYAAWDRDGRMVFRSHGAIGSLQRTGEALGALPFTETVAAVSLDEWNGRRGLPSVDLVKMDIEGAEIEALEGMQATLQRFKPVLLVQAYHRRGGGRTFERCAGFLRGLGYRCREAAPGLGLLVAECGPASEGDAAQPAWDRREMT
jgi:FkbM family methyltransferase